jgi:hypothetical protein
VRRGNDLNDDILLHITSNLNRDRFIYFLSKDDCRMCCGIACLYCPSETVREIPEKLYVITSVVYFVLKESQIRNVK